MRKFGTIAGLMTILLVAMLALTGTIQTRLSGPISARARDGVPGPRPVRIYEGSCGHLGQLVVSLNSLAAPSGDPIGSDDWDRTESSVTTNVPLSLELLIAGSYAINIHPSEDSIDQSIACGNVGGVLEGNYSLTIGLREQSRSEVTGIVYLAPNAANASLSIASVFVTGSGLGDAIGTWDPKLAESDVPVDETPVVAEPTEVVNPTEFPEPTADPEPTEDAEPTQEPEPTEEPEQTEEPEPTEDDDEGDLNEDDLYDDDDDSDSG